MSLNPFSAKPAKSALESTTDDLAARAHSALDATVGSAQSAISDVKSFASDAVDSADRTTRKVVDASAQSFGDMMESATSMSRDASSAIRRNPLLFVGGALLAGFVLAKMRR